VQNPRLAPPSKGAKSAPGAGNAPFGIWGG
jgi:hypothetical protein